MGARRSSSSSSNGRLMARLICVVFMGFIASWDVAWEVWGGLYINIRMESGRAGRVLWDLERFYLHRSLWNI